MCGDFTERVHSNHAVRKHKVLFKSVHRVKYLVYCGKLRYPAGVSNDGSCNAACFFHLFSFYDDKSHRRPEVGLFIFLSRFSFSFFCRELPYCGRRVGELRKLFETSAVMHFAVFIASLCGPVSVCGSVAGRA